MLFFQLPKKILLVLGTVFISFLSIINTASALTISPARFEVSGDPGSSVSGDFTVINDQDNEQTYYTSVQNFEAQGESGTPSFSTTKEDLASWVDIVDKITLKKGDRLKIPFTIKVPKNADAGGHFAAIFLSNVPASAKAGEVAIGAKVGMLILLSVSGDVKEEGGVVSFKLKNDNNFVTSLPVNFSYRFSNTGNDRVNPTGSISIKNTIGMETANINANPTTGNILPKSIRRFDIVWGNEEPISESASFFNKVSYEMRNFALGVYFADLNLSFGLNKTSNNSITFVVFPWHLVLVLVIILAIIYIILRLAIRKYNRYIIHQAHLMSKK